MRRICVVGIALAVLSCTTATPINTGDGKRRYLIDCGRQGASACLGKANEVCPSGYAIDGEDRQFAFSINRMGGGVQTLTTMRVACN